MADYALVPSDPLAAIEIDEASFFYPYEDHRHRIVPIPPAPDYVLGLIVLENDLCTVVDFESFVISKEKPHFQMKKTNEEILLKLSDKNRNLFFALKVPLPEVMALEKEQIQKESSLEEMGEIPYYPAIIEGVGPSLIFSKGRLNVALAKEIGNTLSERFEEAVPIWLNEEKGLASNKPFKSIPSVVQLVLKQGGIKKLAVMQIGNFLFGIDEDEIISIEELPSHLTPMPIAPEWVLGMVNFNLEPIVLIDLGELFEIPYEVDLSSQMMVVVRAGNNIQYAFTVDKVIGSFPRKTFTKLSETDTDSLVTPFSEIIYSDEFSRPIFMINNSMIQQSMANHDIVNILQEKNTPWFNLLTNIRNLETTDIDELSELEETIDVDSILMRRDSFNIAVPLEQVKAISSAFEVVRTEKEEEKFANFEGKWIPSLLLTSFLFKDEEEFDKNRYFSVVISDGNRHAEFLLPNMDLVKVGEPISDESLLDQLRKIGKNLPISVFRMTKNRPTIELDVGRLLEHVYQYYFTKFNLDKGSVEALQGLIAFRPPPSAPKMEKESLLRIWDENGETVLVINDKDNPIAIQSEAIDKVVRNLEEEEKEFEVIPWSGKIPKTKVFVLLKGKERAVEIPLTAKLVVLSSEDIIKEEDKTYIVIDGNNVPLLEM